MNRLVYSVFKAIMVSIIFVFIFDMVFYLYRAVSLNARMESLSTSLKKVVMENNYLPPENAELYQSLLCQMINDFNDSSASISGGKIVTSGVSQKDFISGMHWNYCSDAVDSSGSPMSSASTDIMNMQGDVYQKIGDSWTATKRNLVETDMSKPREYGDIQIVQLRVGVYQPLWGWVGSSGTFSTDYNGESADEFNRADIRSSGTEFSYTYYVPCLKYKSTNTY